MNYFILIPTTIWKTYSILQVEQYIDSTLSIGHRTLEFPVGRYIYIDSTLSIGARTLEYPVGRTIYRQYLEYRSQDTIEYPVGRTIYRQYLEYRSQDTRVSCRKSNVTTRKLCIASNAQQINFMHSSTPYSTELISLVLTPFCTVLDPAVHNQFSVYTRMYSTRPCST